MVQDVSSLPEEDTEEVFSPSPLPTPMTPGTNGDYFSSVDESFNARQRRTGSVQRSRSDSLTNRPDGSSMMTKRKSQRKPLGRLHVEVLLRMVLQDAQTRLAFRAQAMLRADVEFYVPKEGDLDYPRKVAGGF